MRRIQGRNFFYALAEEAANSPEENECYSKKLFQEAPKYNLSELELSSLASALFGAGSDTSSSTLISFVLACCAFPEALPKAWEELDRVVGPHRSPTFEDEPDLVYVKAFVKEVLRWRSVAILGGQPHAPIQDEKYKVDPSRQLTLGSADKKGLVDSQRYMGSRQSLGYPSQRARLPRA